MVRSHRAQPGRAGLILGGLLLAVAAGVVLGGALLVSGLAGARILSAPEAVLGMAVPLVALLAITGGVVWLARQTRRSRHRPPAQARLDAWREAGWPVNPPPGDPGGREQARDRQRRRVRT